MELREVVRIAGSSRMTTRAPFLPRPRIVTRRERREWLAYLFDGAPSHPLPFAMTGVAGEGKTRTDHRYVELVQQKDWAGVEQRLLMEAWPVEAIARRSGI